MIVIGNVEFRSVRHGKLDQLGLTGEGVKGRLGPDVEKHLMQCREGPVQRVVQLPITLFMLTDDREACVGHG